MSENGEESLIILSTSSKSCLESCKQSTSSDETKVKSTPAKEGLDDFTANIRLQFSSLSSSSSIKTEEMIKLQSILEEYIELKDALQKSYVAMLEYFTALRKWQDDVRTQKEMQSKQFNEFQETVGKLRNENLELQKELEHKIEQININEKSIREENGEMTKILSDKTSQIQNMAVQIEKLEQQHLDSSEYIRQLKCENEEEKESNKLKIEREYVPILEHKRIVKDLEENLSENVAKNLEFDEMVQAYSKKVKKLKDYIVKNERENEKERESNKLKIEREYVPILEHRRILRDVEEKLSETVARNLELDEMMQRYLREVKELKDYTLKNESENEKESNKLKIDCEFVPITRHQQQHKRDVEEKLLETVAKNRNKCEGAETFERST